MLAKIKKNEFKKISDEVMFEYSNLEFLSIFKEFKSLLSSNEQVEGKVTYESLLLEIGGVECIQNLTSCILK